jgi:tRNA threonylcarbamoyladenosine biosynthesis protein TsaB
MLDARRMEVYAAVFDSQGSCIMDSQPIIIEEHSFSELGTQDIVCIGDGAAKLKEVFKHREHIRLDPGDYLLARGLWRVALQKWEARDFADLAYVEPKYLKEFKATTPKKLV